MAQPAGHIAVLGLKETLRALDQMDLRTRKEIRKELYDAAVQVRDLSQHYVDPNGLSGWKRWRGGYDSGRIKSRIRLTRLTNKAGGFNTRNFIGVINSDPAGAIWEVAGRKKNGRVPRKGRERTERVWKFSERRGRWGWSRQGTGELLRGGWGNGRAFVAGIKQHAERTSRPAASRVVWYAYEQTDAGFIKRRIEQMVIREGRTTQRKIDMNPY